jgi:nucleoside-diphosphate-sugar epimerase
LGELDPRWTREINVDATVRLAELAKRRGVRRFVFASSCIMYGLLEDDLADEETPLRPTTDYARSKVDAERALMALADDRFSPILLRNGTIYGAAPYMRLDTVFNDFVASAVCEGKVVVRGDGSAWRPVVDVRDAAQAVLAALRAPATVHNQAVNVGADHLNCRIADLAEAAATVVPGATVEVLNLPAQDRRTYRADFAKCGRLFPRLRFRGVAAGGRDLASALRGSVLARGAARRRFLRVDRLRELLDDARLDHSLRWRSRPR